METETTQLLAHSWREHSSQAFAYSFCFLNTESDGRYRFIVACKFIWEFSFEQCGRSPQDQQHLRLKAPEKITIRIGKMWIGVEFQLSRGFSEEWNILSEALLRAATALLINRKLIECIMKTISIKLDGTADMRHTKSLIKISVKVCIVIRDTRISRKQTSHVDSKSYHALRHAHINTRFGVYLLQRSF